MAEDDFDFASPYIETVLDGEEEYAGTPSDAVLIPKTRRTIIPPHSNAGISAPAPPPIVDTITRPPARGTGGAPAQPVTTQAKPPQPAASINWGYVALAVAAVWLLSKLGQE